MSAFLFQENLTFGCSSCFYRYIYSKEQTINKPEPTKCWKSCSKLLVHGTRHTKPRAETFVWVHSFTKVANLFRKNSMMIWLSHSIRAHMMLTGGAPQCSAVLSGNAQSFPVYWLGLESLHLKKVRDTTPVLCQQQLKRISQIRTRGRSDRLMVFWAFGVCLWRVSPALAFSSIAFGNAHFAEKTIHRDSGVDCKWVKGTPHTVWYKILV